MSHIPAELRRLVIERASGCCEYCRTHQDDHYLTHEVDHVISVKHRGETAAANLCWSCFDCNRYKGSDIGSFDLDTEQFTALFNPRSMDWNEHFRLEGAFIVPLTAEGRVSVFLLQLNTHERVIRRQGLIELGRYPCIPNSS